MVSPHLVRNRWAVENVRTPVQHETRARNLAFVAGAVLAPVAVGASVRALTGSSRAGWLAGGASALVAALVRLQFQRWFTAEPAYTVERRIGGLEIRTYQPRVEAHTHLPASDFDTARDQGFRRLATYIFGGNAERESLAMTAPVTIAPRTGSHTVAFVMPRGKSTQELPRPEDPLVELVEVPVRRIAVLRYRGGYSAETVGRQATRLRELAAAAGLTTRGQPIFAGYDPPSTLPFLRRSEIWIELA